MYGLALGRVDEWPQGPTMPTPAAHAWPAFLVRASALLGAFSALLDVAGLSHHFIKCEQAIAICIGAFKACLRVLANFFDHNFSIAFFAIVISPTAFVRP
jgi:hypothetical protein